jgi:hypothetical protein
MRLRQWPQCTRAPLAPARASPGTRSDMLKQQISQFGADQTGRRPAGDGANNG